MSPEIAKKLQNPMIRQALAYWAEHMARMLMDGKSERQAKYWLQRSMGKQVSHHGMEVIWQMALVKKREIEMRALPIILESAHGDS